MRRHEQCCHITHKHAPAVATCSTRWPCRDSYCPLNVCSCVAAWRSASLVNLVPSFRVSSSSYLPLCSCKGKQAFGQHFADKIVNIKYVYTSLSMWATGDIRYMYEA